ncbi:AAA family ATPase [Spiroplasma endosymbiont of Danaus chrysippus]|uniref:AAA family ATPase n=1 Tax=Spiroplasma endosymbiont of Danaus chrysippus TaxID=2691041 RepID=UPI00157B4A9D|nr:AAA family ATPase [Spiroplasma endosymbiont of Danaus chrysippus]
MKLKIKNIGPFNDTYLNIGDITIIAGVNDTGKSYLSRLVFAMVKIATSDIKSEIIKNFFNFAEDTFTQIENTGSNFLETNFNSSEKESTLFKEIESIYNNINLNNKTFMQKWITNFNYKIEKFNNFWINLLTDYHQLLKINDDLITKTLQRIELDTNKDSYKIKIIKYIINIINNDILQTLELFNNKDTDIISYLMANILRENFHGENLRNKKYNNKDSYLKLSLDNNKSLTININENNKFSLEHEFNYLENIIENPIIDATYISDTDQILNLIIEETLSKKQSSYMLESEKLKLSLNNIFKFKKCHYLDDFKNKINIQKNIEQYSNLKLVLIKQKINQELENYFGNENKINFENGSLTKNGITIKLANSSRGLKIIESFKEMIKSDFFKEGNLVIIDEPEAYIHPEWQYLFTKLLLNIAKIINFKLIISTHSPYILETITSLASRDFKNLNFKYNFINKDKNFDSCIIEENSLDHINEALSYPYRELDEYEFKWDIKK